MSNDPLTPCCTATRLTGARHTGCVAVPVRLGVEVSDDDDVTDAAAVAEALGVGVFDDEDVPELVRVKEALAVSERVAELLAVPERVAELLGVPVREAETLDVSVREAEMLGVPVREEEMLGVPVWDRVAELVCVELSEPVCEELGVLEPVSVCVGDPFVEELVPVAVDDGATAMPPATLTRLSARSTMCSPPSASMPTPYGKRSDALRAGPPSPPN